ncbi:MAG: taurine ABC transporter ATP-binding subunit [Gammaproteobacteria bacterium]|nr:MAG: taurine ABC transporter ATP-binding subunit [Gammaproteobacteria bacterium]
MNDRWLNIANLSFGYPSRPLFHELSLSVSTDQPIVGILGPSGIGKTTLLNLIAGFEMAMKGSICVHDEIVKRPSANRPVVFQDHNLFPWKSVSKNIELGLLATKISRADRREKVCNLLEAMGLEQCAELYPRELSGGMQQRVGLARAMAVSPQCILMDEPFSALDETTRKSVRDFFKRTLEANKTNAIIVTHDAGEAMVLCDYLIVINSVGKVTTVETNMIDLESLRIVLSNSVEINYRK